MSEPVFFRRGSGLTVEEIAKLVGAESTAPDRRAVRIYGLATADRAGPSDLVFADDAADADALQQSQAGACLTLAAFAPRIPQTTIVLVVEHPSRAYAAVAAALYPGATRLSSQFEREGRLADAFVHPTAHLESGVTIDPCAVIGPRAEIGSGTVIGPTAVVGPDVRIGRECSIGAGASMTNALIGDRVMLHPGCRIGDAALDRPHHAKAAQIGRVILQDSVEIGANAVVDRGQFHDTVIGEGSIVCALLRVPGGVMIGRHCAIVAGDTDFMPEIATAAAGSLWIEDGSRLSASRLMTAWAVRTE